MIRFKIRCCLSKMKKSSFKNILLFIFFFFLFISGFVLGRLSLNYRFLKGFQKIEISREIPKKTVDFALFWRVWDILESSYYDKSKIDFKKMVYGAIKGMVSSLGDPYTFFLDPEDNKIAEEDLQGSFEGIGIQIGFKGSRLVVISPLPDSPAQKAGLKAGDFIIGIEDKEKNLSISTEGISMAEAVSAIRGKKGTKVKLVILRDGVDEPLTFEITRDKIDVPSVVLSFENGGKTAVIKVIKFSAETKMEWDKKVAEILKNKNITGLVIDLRGNTGGYLTSAVDLASDFLDVGSVVVVEEGKDGREEYKTNRLPRLKNYKIVILVNGGTASASEILAGALRDQKGIKLIGENTFGKGTIQEPVSLDDGANLHLTISRWLTPSGFWVNEKGLEPDEKIEDNPQTEKDEQLQKALESVL